VVCNPRHPNQVQTANQWQIHKDGRSPLGSK
jgi:hypothetical protein